MAKRHYDNQVETMMNYDKSGWPQGSMITQVETMMNYDKSGWPKGSMITQVETMINYYSGWPKRQYDNPGRNYDKL
jgi:carbamate kinase